MKTFITNQQICEVIQLLESTHDNFGKLNSKLIEILEANTQSQDGFEEFFKKTETFKNISAEFSKQKQNLMSELVGLIK